MEKMNVKLLVCIVFLKLGSKILSFDFDREFIQLDGK